jgi:hypothetical protein
MTCGLMFNLLRLLEYKDVKNLLKLELCINGISWELSFIIPEDTPLFHHYLL